MDAALIKDIKFNCDVSDAQYWGYFSVCGLLMRYRDLYRSETGLKPWADIRRDEIAAWIASKETKWPELEREPYRKLTIGNQTFDPFDVSGINRVLRQEKLIYGAGYGMYLKPSFFLAELRSVQEISGLTAYTSGRELVRDLLTSPGMLQEKSIFLRLEPLMVLLLYKHSELNARRVSALEDAFARYGFPHRQIIDSTFEQRLETMAERYAEILLAHELAEAVEEVREWKEVLSLAAGDRQVEHFLRAVKDLLADTSDQGPYKRIIETRDRGALGLSIALTDGYRKILYPEIKEAYAALSSDVDWTVVEQVRRAGYERFRSQRDDIVSMYRRGSGRDTVIEAIKGLLRKAESAR
ncbi:MAG: Sfum_1244 family protein [Betaproteobacteria bacterium]